MVLLMFYVVLTVYQTAKLTQRSRLQLQPKPQQLL